LSSEESVVNETHSADMQETDPGDLSESPCGGPEFRQMIQASMNWLERHTPSINALNVFPVPDGDTGTNMYLTLQSAWQEITANDSMTTPAVAQAMAHGALMGARGNSGVILSQLFRGMAQVLEQVQFIDAATLARALDQASQTAYKAVIRPVEGTILTVARRAAEAATEAAGEMDDIEGLLHTVVAAAKQAVAETPGQLPVLAEAGVVDAGGQGFYVILDGMLRHLRGETILSETDLEASVDVAHADGLAEGYGYDVQFILRGEGLDVDRIRADIDAMGDSTLVVGDSSVIKVHVHTPEPGYPLNYGAALGSLSRIIVENMQEQFEEFSVGRPAAPPRVAPKAAPDGIAIVAVVPGAGLARVYESLGTAAIVEGGQTMNPSTENLLKSIEALENRDIIILPNNKNVILTAQQAQTLSDRNIQVVPSKTVPQGISALLAFNYQADLENNVRVMQGALDEVQTGEVTQAVRSVTLDGIDVQEGQIIGLLNGRLVLAGSQIDDVVIELIEKMSEEDLEIVTLYYGEGVTQGEAEALAGRIAERYPDYEIEAIDGGQPHYPYILSGE
jgi:uncharacterized protein